MCVFTCLPLEVMMSQHRFAVLHHQHCTSQPPSETIMPTSLDHEIQKGYILGVSSPHKLENFHWYHELGPLLGFTKQVFASLRSGAVLYNGHFLCAPYNHAEIFKIRHCLAVFDAGLFT